jgi:hypothetical protein
MDKNTPQSASNNPLSKHFRQPAIYLKLPSGGKHWAEHSISMPQSGEIGIMPMTTKDEITLKTPDALLNGQGIVDVIHSCCPDVKDAWQMPSIDVDATLIAIRIASYGNQMDFTSSCTHCETKQDHAIDLGVTLGSITAPDYDVPLKVDDLTIKFNPQPYFSLNKTNMIAFEEQQIIRSLSNIENDPEATKEHFDLRLKKIIELNIGLLSTSTDSVTTGDGTVVTNPDHISEFYSNADTKLVAKVQDYIKELSNTASIKPVQVTCTNEECGKPFNINLTFDYASFFA